MSMVMELHLELNETKKRFQAALKALESGIDQLKEAQGEWVAVDTLFTPQWVETLRDICDSLESQLEDCQDALTDERPAIALPEAVK